MVHRRTTIIACMCIYIYTYMIEREKERAGGGGRDWLSKCWFLNTAVSLGPFSYHTSNSPKSKKKQGLAGTVVGYRSWLSKGSR